MKKKILKLTTIIMLLVITYATIASALSLTVSMETNNTTIAESTEFTVTVKVSNLDVGDSGVNTFSAYINS